MPENGSQSHYRQLVIVLAVVGLSRVASAAVAAPLSDAARSQAQQLVSLIDYVAADYPRAVSGGKVAIESEYAEQKALLHDAAELARALPSKAVGLDAVAPVEQLEALAGRVASGEEMERAIHALHGELVARYGIATAPANLPDKVHGKALYAQACAACHGLDGKAQTATAREQKVAPARFDEAERMDKLSPFRAFNAITYGVTGTSMPSYDVLSEKDRWDLASYLFTLRAPKPDLARARQALAHAGLVFGPQALATQSDGELLAKLRARGVAEPEVQNALAYLRQQQAYEPAAASDLAAVRQAFAAATETYSQGDRAGAKHALLSAYLDGFEPKEPALRARDSDLVAEVEDAFVQLRGAVDSGADADVVRARAARLDALLERTQGEGGRKADGQVAFWGSLIIVLREGLECALLVATLLAVLKRSGRPSLARAVHAGWTLALAVGVGTWFISGRLIAASGANRETVEGAVQLLTAAVLFYASHWLLARAHAQRWLEFLKKQAPTAGGAAAVLGLAFLAVFREMFEVVVFYRGLLIETGNQVGMLWLGGAVGGAALLVAVLGFMRVGKKLPLRPFLLTCGLLLVALSVVMVGHGVRALQEAGWVHLSPLAFHSIEPLGLYNSLEGLFAQAALLLAVGISALWSRLADKPAPAPKPLTPAAR